MNQFVFWSIEVPSALVMWTCALCVMTALVKCTINELFKKGEKKDEN